LSWQTSRGLRMRNTLTTGAWSFLSRLSNEQMSRLLWRPNARYCVLKTRSLRNVQATLVFL
jgi:hypothetical protein